jgi:hypothetical protein
MAEVQTTRTDAAEVGEVFVRFLLMQQQQALLALGRHPNPPPGVAPANLGLARVFIEQLAMIKIKMQGNLQPAEERLLGATLASLQAAYVEVSRTES